MSSSNSIHKKLINSSEMDSTFIPNPKYIYKIIPIYAQNLAFEIKNGKKEDGTNIELGELKEVPYQYFKLIQNNNSKFTIESIYCKDKVIEVKNNKMTISSNIQLSHKTNIDKQLFHIVKEGENSYSILSSLDEHFCLDIQSRGNKKGANVQLFKRNYSSAQLFKLIGKRNIYQSIEYALKYSIEKNPDYKICEPNSANFCSQCLFEGGVESDIIWNKDSDTFIDPTLLKQYFCDRGIDWIKSPSLRDINPGDIVYKKFYEDKFDEPAFVIRKNNEEIIYCGNSIDVKEGYLKYNLIKAVLKTSFLYK